MSTAIIPDDVATVAATAAAQALVDAETARVAAEAVVVPPAGDPAVVVPPVVAPPAVPETYDLKLPDGSTLDPAIVERTAAIARELGLGNEAGQKVLDAITAEATTAIAAEVTKAIETQKASYLESLKPDVGAEWKRINEAYKAAALADPDLGGGDAAKLTAVAEKAQQALDKYFPEVTTDILKTTMLASNPLFLKGLARIGQAMSEPGTVVFGVNPGTKPKLAAGMYENDGRGPLPPEPAKTL